MYTTAPCSLRVHWDVPLLPLDERDRIGSDARSRPPEGPHVMGNCPSRRVGNILLTRSSCIFRYKRRSDARHDPRSGMQALTTIPTKCMHVAPVSRNLMRNAVPYAGVSCQASCRSARGSAAAVIEASETTEMSRMGDADQNCGDDRRTSAELAQRR